MPPSKRTPGRGTPGRPPPAKIPASCADLPNEAETAASPSTIEPRQSRDPRDEHNPSWQSPRFRKKRRAPARRRTGYRKKIPKRIAELAPTDPPSPKRNARLRIMGKLQRIENHPAYVQRPPNPENDLRARCCAPHHHLLRSSRTGRFCRARTKNLGNPNPSAYRLNHGPLVLLRFKS